MKANRILFITQEITPFVPESEIANIGRTLPQDTQERGREIRIFTPKYPYEYLREAELRAKGELNDKKTVYDQIEDFYCEEEN